MTNLHRELPMHDLLVHLGFSPKKKGSKSFICCPFHDEKTPSGCVYAHSFHCFGCGANYDQAGFLMALEKIDFMQAKNKIYNIMGKEIEPMPARRNKDFEKKLIAAQEKAIVKELYMRFIDLCRRFTPKTLKDQAFEYCTKRGITKEQLLHFGAFVASKEAYKELEKEYTLHQLKLSGLANEKGHFILWSAPLCVPLKNPLDGQIYGCQGRRLDNQKEFKYVIASPKDLGFELYFFSAPKPENHHSVLFVVTEGWVDLAPFYEYSYCLALTGQTKKLDFTAPDLEFMPNMNNNLCKDAIANGMFLIGDAGGDKKTYKSIIDSFTCGLEKYAPRCLFFDFDELPLETKYKDVNELVQNPIDFEIVFGHITKPLPF